MSNIDFIHFMEATFAEEAYRMANVEPEFSGLLYTISRQPWTEDRRQRVEEAAETLGILRNSGKRIKPECWALDCGETESGKIMWALFGWNA